MRRRDLLILLPLAIAASSGCATDAADGGFEVTPIRPGQERVARIGAFRLDGAWRIRSGDRRFGGLSTLEIRDGRLRAISDQGNLVTATLQQDEVGRVQGFADWRIERIAFAEDTDVESATRMADGSLVLGLERPAGLVAIDPASGTPRPLAELPGLADAPYNRGLEAIVGLGDGSLLAFAEESEIASGIDRAWHVDPAGSVTLLGWPIDDGFLPVDAARDGDTVYVLERSASVLGGWRSRIRRVETKGLVWSDGLVLESLELGRIDIQPYAENYEGIALEVVGDRKWLWLVSDDNFLAVQETKLLRLEIVPPAP